MYYKLVPEFLGYKDIKEFPEIYNRFLEEKDRDLAPDIHVRKFILAQSTITKQNILFFTNMYPIGTKEQNIAEKPYAEYIFGATIIGQIPIFKGSKYKPQQSIVAKVVDHNTVTNILKIVNDNLAKNIAEMVDNNEIILLQSF